MDFTVLKTKVFVSPLFFAVLTSLLVIDKTGVSAMAILFSVLHELGHILALICEKICPKSVFITPFGINLSLPENLSTAEKIPVLMAGFTVNFLLAVLFFALGKIVSAYVNLIIGIFTAIPIPSTDGGSILKVLLEEFASQKSEKIFKIISLIFAFIFLVFLIFAMVLTKNYFILIAVLYLIFCIIKNAAK